MWFRKKEQAHEPRSQRDLTPQPVFTIPAYSHSTEGQVSVIKGPMLPGVHEQIMREFLCWHNDVLKTLGVHASQVDGGFEYRYGTDEYPSVIHQHRLHPWDLILENVVHALDVRFPSATYQYAGLELHKDTESGYLPFYDAGQQSLISYISHSAMLLIEHYGELADKKHKLAQAWQRRLEATAEQLTHARVPVNPGTLCARLTLETARPTSFAPGVNTGYLLPQKSSGTLKQVPQLYYEYMRGGLPFSYLVAAIMPVIREDTRNTEVSHHEWAPRFSILDVYALRHLPTGLVLETVNASREALLQSVLEKNHV